MSTEKYQIIEEIYRRDYRIFLRTAKNFCGCWETAKDILQRSFLSLLIYADKIESKPHAEAVLNIAIKHRWFKEFKKKKRHSLLSDSIWGEEGLESLFQEAPPVPKEHILSALLQQLPPKCFFVLKARFFDDLSFKEIAGILGISVGSTQSAFQDALTYLREPERIRFFTLAEIKKKQEKEWVDLWRTGLAPKQIAKHFNVECSVVRRAICERNKVKKDFSLPTLKNAV